MKYNLKYYINGLLLLVSTIVLLNSCESLQEDPPSLLTPESVNSEETIESAVNGLYDVWQSNGAGMFVRYMLADGPLPYTKSRLQGDSGAGWTQYAWNPATSGFLESIWNSSYTLIGVSNSLLDLIPGKLDSDKEEELLAEARFNRADMYFLLVRTYGGVPLHLETTTDIPLDGTSLPRSSEEEVYAAIVEDLIFAESRLPATRPAQENSRPTAGAAKALLGKVYLQMAGLNEQGLLSTGDDGYALAEAKLLEVVNSGNYALQPNIQDVFDVNNEWNSEIIHGYSVIRDNIATATLVPWGYGPPNSPFNGGLNSFVQFGYLQTYYDSFDENDARRDWLAFEYIDRNGDLITYNTPNEGIDLGFVSSYTDDETGMSLIKYIDPDGGNGPLIHENDYVFIRYADVLLMLAEAQVKSGKDGLALQNVNEIRSRAGIANLDSVTLDDIKQERRWELAMEYQGYYDLQRWGDVKEAFDASPAVNAAGTVWHDGLIRMPLHANTLSANANLTQNPGY
ncbi:RagB/SusD family nutrient uptake outer membrane protein [Maribacter sp. MAR_2009_72]|uniref:RagB/SusD family nutrient uptake outer membrane protein n=1 Tax=Maribacter sp. MAR_2009_72 TaxID=1250050 RepID=UPI00119B73A0|nr:RagB/SusD family nutrient uptake outer membrane protein [Maribacter sp. MAR_2009_72]TVZ14918.1 putative outer membrane starch-binding protein [Maribacter sp. MAR_2009_72]